MRGLLALFLIPNAAAGFGFPEALTDRGRIMESAYDRIFIAGLAFFIIVMVGMAWILWRYREGSGHGQQTNEKHRHSTAAEVTWTVIPLAVVLWIGWISYVGLVQLDLALEPGEEDMQLRIEATQWNWEAKYSEGFSVFSSPGERGAVAEANYFLVPADTNILVNVTSLDVIHALHIMDANRATVVLVDANPAGDHKYNTQPMNLPVGDYPVQCREMCFNPGHAYMKAHFKAVPKAEYDDWAKERRLCSAKPVCLVQDQGIGPAGLTAPEDVTGVVGARYVERFSNGLDHPVVIGRPGETVVTVPAGGSTMYKFDLAGAGGHRYVVSRNTPDGGLETLAERIFAAVAATPLNVALGDFEFLPATIKINAGETYFVTLENHHNVPHNMYAGAYGGEVIAASTDIAGGGGGGMLLTIDAPGEYDLWCNVAGHYDRGMFGKIVVS